MSVTDQFAKAFEPKNASHVKWLADFFKYAENLEKTTQDISTFINGNPMGIHLKREEMLDWVHIHFILGMKYAQHVLKGDAFIPGSIGR
jgi:hypothetical protein